LALSSGYSRKVASAESWRRLMRGELDLGTIAGVVARRVRGSARHRLSRLGRALGMEASEGVASDLAAAAARGVRMHFVFAAGDPGQALLQRKAGTALEALLEQGLASIDVVPDGDHTFTGLAARQRLITVLDLLVAPEHVS
jgi:hypothetical protein